MRENFFHERVSLKSRKSLEAFNIEGVRCNPVLDVLKSASRIVLFLPRFALRYKVDDDAEDHNPSEEQGE